MSQKTAEIDSLCAAVEQAGVAMASAFCAYKLAGDTPITRARKDAAMEAFVRAVDAIRVAAKVAG